ncbi:MAG: hypothetical protein MRY32_08690 [Rickettsiales bacterium]|nr:hypothetical protein [Rickettsiales bacterium]
MRHAMEMAREELGDDAVMLNSNHQPDGSVVVTFAIDRIDDEPLFEEQRRPTNMFAPEEYEEDEQFYDEPEAAAEETHDFYAQEEAPEETISYDQPILNSMRETLEHHATPRPIINKMLNYAATLRLDQHQGISGLQHIIAETLQRQYRFEPLNLKFETLRVILVGPHGVGKTNTAAKIAAKLVVDNRDVKVISADTNRAAGNEQLSAFANILGVELKVARSRAALKEIIKNTPSTTSIIVDSAGCNPYDFQDLKALGEFASLQDLEPILVCAAGTDAGEAEEIASVFSFLDIERMLITRADCARRFGGILSAATAGDYSLCHFTSSSKVMGEFYTLDAISLSELFMQYQRDRKAA